tara:strand:- start:256 stop:918 length:663 start_codon:yes stop_codon:yes gene_type:complete
MPNLKKDVIEKSYSFHGAKTSIKNIAEWFVDTMKLDSVTNLKTVDGVIKLVNDTMKPIRRDCELGFINSYADNNKDKTLRLFLHNDTFVLCDKHNKANPTLSLTVKDMWEITKTPYGNMDKPKAPTNKYGASGVSLKAHIKEPRAVALNDVKVTYNRLTSEMKSIVKGNCGIKTDNSSKALILRANSSVGSLYNLFESLKDDKAIAVLKSFDKKYLNKIS